MSATLGFLTGLAVCGFGLWIWVKLIGLLAPAQPPSRQGAILIVIAFLLKLPIFFIGTAIVYRLGGQAPGGFLGAMALVYCVFVRWAVAKR